jgi:hypothetical protein
MMHSEDMQMIHVQSLAKSGVMALCLALMGLAHATSVEYVGQVDEVSVVNRVIVIDGMEYRLGSPVNFTSDYPGTDLVTGLRPGAYVTYNGDPDRLDRPITRIHIHAVSPE